MPPPAEHRKRPQDEISRVQTVAAVEIGFLLRIWCFQGIWVYIGGKSTSVEQRGAHEGGGRAPLPRGFLVDSLMSTPSPLDHVCSENHVPEGFIPFGLRLIFFFCEALK